MLSQTPLKIEVGNDTSDRLAASLAALMALRQWCSMHSALGPFHETNIHQTVMDVATDIGWDSPEMHAAMEKLDQAKGRRNA